MGRFDLNLSTRPFPAYRAINVALAVFLVVLAVISIWQAYSFFHYSSLAAEIRDNERDVRVAAEVLKDRLQELENRLDRPEAAAKLMEIDFLNDLIARRHLSWTRILSTLEDIVPDSVHLVSLGPEFVEDGTLLFRIQARARSIADIGEFIQSLEDSPVFNEVTVSNESVDTGDIDVTLAVTYLPKRETP